MAVPVAIPLLRRAAAIDVPSVRSSHTVPTPRGGGAPIAVGPGRRGAGRCTAPPAVAFALAVAAFGRASGSPTTCCGLPAGPAAGDAGRGQPGGRAACSCSRSALPPAGLAAAAVAVAVWLIGFVNAFNFMDGVNGISAAHALIGGGAYALPRGWCARRVPARGGRGRRRRRAGLPALERGPGPGLPRRRGQLRARAWRWPCWRCTPVMPASRPRLRSRPLALYLADTAWTLQRRIRAGEPWLEAHRTHTYQRCATLGWSHQRVTAATAALTVALCLLGRGRASAGHPALRADRRPAGLGCWPSTCAPRPCWRGAAGGRGRPDMRILSSPTTSRPRRAPRRPGCPRWPPTGRRTATR